MSTQRLVDAFCDLVRVEAPSYAEAAVARVVARELEALGCAVRFDDTAEATGSDCGNMVAELAGTEDATLVLSAHFDTVGPCAGVEPVVRDGVVYSAGDTILGADDRAGIACIIEALRRVIERGSERPRILVVMTVAEEVGLVGAKAMDRTQVEGDVCLVLDADGRPGGLVSAAPTQYLFEATFYGRAAHAGVAPEKGISAIKMAADAIARMRIGRIDAATTANVGTISGGVATNVVTARVDVSGECRSLDRETVDALRDEMTDAMRSATVELGGEVDIAWTLAYEGYRHDQNEPIWRLLEAAVRDVGLEPFSFTTGGGSDANIFSAHGIPTLALGCGMQAVHSTEEFVRIEDLESMTELLIAVARRMTAQTGE